MGLVVEPPDGLHELHDSGGPRAGHGSGASLGKPTCSSILLATRLSGISAIRPIRRVSRGRARGREQARTLPWEGSRLYRIDVADGTLTWRAIEVAWRWEDVAVLADGRPVVVGRDVAGPNATGIARVYAP